jgi:hypothetical protein
MAARIAMQCWKVGFIHIIPIPKYPMFLQEQSETVNQKVFPKERFLRNANAIATDEAGINNKIR